MRSAAKRLAIALAATLLTSAAASADVTIAINLPVFPRLVLVPGYPVYYAPSVRANYYFYDGLYWVFNVDDGYWYSSSWYNGPWVFVEPVFVPSPLLVIPGRYYPVRPRYWAGWAPDRPPRWGEYWGRDWETRRRGWDHWDRNRHWNPAPLPVYQQRYDRAHYPTPAEQRRIYGQHYSYRPADDFVRRQEPAIVDRQQRGGERAPKGHRYVAPSREQETARPQLERRERGPDRPSNQRWPVRERDASPAPPRQREPAWHEPQRDSNAPDSHRRDPRRSNDRDASPQRQHQEQQRQQRPSAPQQHRDSREHSPKSQQRDARDHSGQER